MAVSDSVDPESWFAEQIGACEPDLLRSMVKTMAEGPSLHGPGIPRQSPPTRAPRRNTGREHHHPSDHRLTCNNGSREGRLIHHLRGRDPPSASALPGALHPTAQSRRRDEADPVSAPYDRFAEITSTDYLVLIAGDTDYEGVEVGMVVAGADLFVRAYRGRASRSYQAALLHGTGCTRIGGSTWDVTFTVADPSRHEELDVAYRAKYGHNSSLVTTPRPAWQPFRST